MAAQDVGRLNGGAVSVELYSLSREKLEELTMDKKVSWQTQSAVWAHIKSGRWQKWRKHDGEPYRAFSEYCWDVKVSPSTAYGRAGWAEHPRFASVAELTLSQTLTKRLYDLPDRLFEIFRLLAELELSELALTALLDSANPEQAANDKAKTILTLLDEKLFPFLNGYE